MLDAYSEATNKQFKTKESWILSCKSSKIKETRIQRINNKVANDLDEI